VRLHLLVRQSPRLEEHREGIAAEYVIGEHVDLDEAVLARHESSPYPLRPDADNGQSPGHFHVVVPALVDS
jgi:hypothetical protein